MGASKSTAKNIKMAECSMPAEPAKVSETPKTPETVANKLPSKEVAEVKPISLPTQSWRTLLQESEKTLSADAKPFIPSKDATVVPQAPAAQDGPEWMQYLSRKFENNGLEASTTLKPKGKGKGKNKGGGSGVPLDAGGGPGNSQAANCSSGGQNVTDGSASGGSVVIHTEAYLKLLKEGAARKKVPANSQTARRTLPTRAARFTAGELGADAAAQSEALPITTSSLAKKWSSVLSKQAGQADETPEEPETQQLTTQDDILLEKIVADQDLSDPAYYSETEEVKAGASMHRLGRRANASNVKVRTYVMQDLCFLLDRAVGMLLLRLQRFMDCQRIFNYSEFISEEKLKQCQQRRFVIGLKEVSRRTKQSKVECLIVAPDIEEDANSGGLDDRMRELLASAYQSQTPVIFALSRARLGKALGKSLNISVLGILDSTGARELLEESLQRANDCRQAWLARLE